MKFQLNFGRVDVKPVLRELIERRLETTFNRLVRWIGEIRVYIEDVNGPRGGKGKQCRLTITARGVESIVVTETDETIYAAASKAIRRAGVVLAKRVKQQRDKKKKVVPFFRRENDASQITFESESGLSF